MKRQEEERGEQHYLSVSEIARRLGRTRDTVKRDVTKGRIPTIKVPSQQNTTGFEFRIALEDANAYIAQKQKEMKEKAPSQDTDHCGCCGTGKGNILGDIDKSTQKTYGYLCVRCYKLVRDFHADLKRIYQTIDYIKKTRHNNG